MSLRLAAALAGALWTHPLHTTLTEISIDASRHVIRATVRVFSDDLARATGKPRLSDAEANAYAAAAFRVTDGAARPVQLSACGVRRSGDLLWICLEGSVPGDRRVLQVRDTMLCELFSDQVNIVQIVEGTAKRSLLFTRGDRAKSLW